MTTLSLLTNTRDRADTLERLLASIDTVRAAELDAEVVVVDNGSTDRTPAVIEEFASRAACRVEHVVEPVPGAARAKNAGLARAAGTILAFTDDDCVLGDGFLDEVLRAFELDRFDYCGGRSLLLDDTDAPYATKPSTRFRLIPPRTFLPAGTVLGLCMAWRADVVRSLGGFDPMLGPGTPFRGDEIDLCARAARAGHWGAYVPSILMYHGHGRKPGSAELEANMRGDDYARGAYYASCLLDGDWRTAEGWVRTTWRNRHRYRPALEVRGALHYTAARIRHRAARRRQPARNA